MRLPNLTSIPLGKIALTSLSGMLFAGFAIGSVSLGFFLYRYFYQTITQSEEIIVLRREVAPESINIEEVQAVIDAYTKKTASSETISWNTQRNPFTAQPLATPPLPVETSTSTPPLIP